MPQLVFGMDPASLVAKGTPKALAVMHIRHGTAEGKQCGACKHLITRKYAGTYFKCELFNMAASVQSDWRKKWQACGKWEAVE